MGGFSKAKFTKVINYIFLWTCVVNLFLIEFHSCHISSKQMGISANIMIVHSTNIMQLAGLEDPVGKP